MTLPDPTHLPASEPCPVAPYTPPALVELGTIGAVTAGPDDGTVDQLIGSGGGFLVATGTS
ncbi:MAG: hypothetical protein Rubg2KO_25220 [Rubricoccaceae bacterium]